jgi:hypothetical protein
MFGNDWKKLLYDTELEYDFEGFEVSDCNCITLIAGENATKDDVLKWLVGDGRISGLSDLNIM